MTSPSSRCTGRWPNITRATKSYALAMRGNSTATVARIRLYELIPLAFPQFGSFTNRRTILLDVGRFEITGP